MTSGEWDLRALKALEEEENQQFSLIGKPESVSSSIQSLLSSSITPSLQQLVTSSSSTINEECPMDCSLSLSSSIIESSPPLSSSLCYKQQQQQHNYPSHLLQQHLQLQHHQQAEEQNYPEQLYQIHHPFRLTLTECHNHDLIDYKMGLANDPQHQHYVELHPQLTGVSSEPGNCSDINDFRQQQQRHLFSHNSKRKKSALGANPMKRNSYRILANNSNVRNQTNLSNKNERDNNIMIITTNANCTNPGESVVDSWSKHLQNLPSIDESNEMISIKAIPSPDASIQPCTGNVYSVNENDTKMIMMMTKPKIPASMEPINITTNTTQSSSNIPISILKKSSSAAEAINTVKNIKSPKQKYKTLTKTSLVKSKTNSDNNNDVINSHATFTYDNQNTNDDEVDSVNNDDKFTTNNKNEVTKLPKAPVVEYFEIENHIKNCSCSCNHMGYGNSIDYQTTGFGCLPDVTDHLNVRCTTVASSSSRQNSASEFAESSGSGKSKKYIRNKTEHKRKYCIFSLSIIITLVLFALSSIAVYHVFILRPNRNSHEQRLKIIQRILKEVPFIDGNYDLTRKIRKYLHNNLDLIDIKHDVKHKIIWNKPSLSQTDIQKIKKGMLSAQIWSAFVPCDAQGLDAIQLVLEQIDSIQRLTKLYPKDLLFATSSQEIMFAHKKGFLASLIGVEGGHAIGSSLGVLRSLQKLGVRYLTLTHQCDTSWAGSSYMSMKKGLTTFGRAIIKEMNRLGVMIDLSHSSDITAREVLEVTRAPVIFSHTLAHNVCNLSHNMPHDILRAVADNGGLIMISFNSQYVSCDEYATIDDVIAHIKYIRSVVGIQHIGIGTGFDGITNSPKHLEDVSKYPDLFATLLEDSNWSEEDIAMLAGKNFLRVLRSVENVRDYWRRANVLPVEVAEPIKKSQCTSTTS